MRIDESKLSPAFNAAGLLAEFDTGSETVGSVLAVRGHDWRLAEAVELSRPR